MLDRCELYVENINYPGFINVVCSTHHACNMNWHKMAFRISYARGHHIILGVSA